jgi:ribosomal protein S27E
MTDVRTSEVECPGCGNNFTVTHAHGDTVECPECGRDVETVPATPEPDNK